jgi:hypothetical protein
MPPKPDLKIVKNPPAASLPGVMGDGTEEQNLNQPGDPSARVTKADVTIAFGGKNKPKTNPRR